MRLAPLLVALAALGCKGGASGSEAPDGPSGPTALTRDLRQELAGREPAHACGPHRAFTSDRALLVLSARECLSCRSVGYLLRQLGSRTEFDVLTPDQDADEVCAFMRQEKAAGAVFRFKDLRFRDQSLADRFLLFRRAGGGGIAGVVLEADAVRLLEEWDSLVQAGPAF